MAVRITVGSAVREEPPVPQDAQVTIVAAWEQPGAAATYVEWSNGHTTLYTHHFLVNHEVGRILAARIDAFHRSKYSRLPTCEHGHVRHCDECDGPWCLRCNHHVGQHHDGHGYCTSSSGHLGSKLCTCTAFVPDRSARTSYSEAIEAQAVTCTYCGKRLLSGRAELCVCRISITVL